MSPAGIRVTVTDLTTGESESAEIRDDYIIVCAGTCHVSSFQTHASGTHQLTIKGRRDTPAAEPPAPVEDGGTDDR